MYTRLSSILKQVVLLQGFLLATATQPGAAAEQTDFVEGSQALSAEQLVTWVQERNPDIGNFEAAVVEAASMEIPAGSLDDPQLSYGFAPATIDGLRRPDGTTRGFNQRIEISQHIPWPGTLSLREKQAQHLTEAAEYRLADRRLQLNETIKTGFAEWYYVHRALAINAANQDLLMELQSIAESQYAVGRVSGQDVLQAEVKQALLQHQRLTLEQNRLTIQAQLNAMLNRRADSALPPPGTFPQPDLPPAFEQLQELASMRHPELRRIEAELRAGETQIELAEKRFYPDIRLMAGYEGLWEDTEQQWMIGASINIPFNRGKYQAGLIGARAKAMQTRWQLQDRRNYLLANLEQARAEVEESIHVIRLYQNRLLPLAVENLNAALADYRAGLGDFLNVITAEDDKLKTELSLEQTYADYIRRHAALERWTGTPLLAPLNTKENQP